MMAVCKMCDSVPSAIYSPVCNVLPSMENLAHPTYRLYDNINV